jgi:hypothetical protein
VYALGRRRFESSISRQETKEYLGGEAGKWFGRGRKWYPIECNWGRMRKGRGEEESKKRNREGGSKEMESGRNF